MKKKNSCDWPGDNPLMIDYHDREWGVPVHDDKKLFEFLLLDAFQAGLSWLTILKKRENFRTAFSDFNYNEVANYDDKNVETLLNDSGIIRNRLKIISTISNAQAFLNVQKEYGSFDTYIWSFVGHSPITNRWEKLSEIPSRTELSDKISKDLQNRGFKYVGSTIIYAFMQAAGLVNDHVISCHRYNAILR